jgi:Na+/proline symporter
MRNIYCRLVKRSLGQTEEVWVLRGIVGLFAVLCILFNLFVPGTVIEYFLIMLTFGSSLIWPVLFGLFREKFPWINGAGCFWGSILGFVTAFIWAIVFQNPFDLEPIFPTLTVSLISNIVISLMTQNTRKEMEEG